jgi:hypothetical protein
MSFLIETLGESGAQIHFPGARHSNGDVGVPTIERNVGVSTITQNVAPTIAQEVDVSTIARNVDADNCIEGLQLWFQSGKNFVLD